MVFLNEAPDIVFRSSRWINCVHVRMRAAESAQTIMRIQWESNASIPSGFVARGVASYVPNAPILKRAFSPDVVLVRWCWIHLAGIHRNGGSTQYRGRGLNHQSYWALRRSVRKPLPCWHMRYIFSWSFSSFIVHRDATQFQSMLLTIEHSSERKN